MLGPPLKFDGLENKAIGQITSPFLRLHRTRRKAALGSKQRLARGVDVLAASLTKKAAERGIRQDYDVVAKSLRGGLHIEKWSL